MSKFEFDYGVVYILIIINTMKDDPYRNRSKDIVEIIRFKNLVFRI